jgi:P27 family predicted phage terminase small subunit
LIRGNPGRRPIRHEPEPAIPAQCPEPLPHVTGLAADEWRRVGPELYRLGLLTVLDTSAFAAYCIAYGRWHLAEQMLAEAGAFTAKGSTGNTVVNPLLKIAAQAARDLIRLGNEFGLTPSARARVAAGRMPEERSKWGDLLA